MNVTASVPLNTTTSDGIILSILSRTTCVSVAMVDAFNHVKLIISSTRGSWLAISINGERS